MIESPVLQQLKAEWTQEGAARPNEKTSSASSQSPD